MNILVTGGFGFIGFHLVEALIRQGHKVRVLDNRDKFHCKETVLPSFIHDSRVETAKADITVLEACIEASAGMDAIFHTAAVVLVRESYQDPQRTFEINVKGTENLLKAAVTHKIKRFIYSSTGKLYGNNEELLSKETSVLNPGTPYAKTKYQAEQMVEEYAKMHNLNVFSLRYFSIYGPQMKLFGGMIGDILKSTLNGGISKINALPSMERDFTYIDDVVQANLLCLKVPVSGYEVFNVASGAVTTIEGLVSEVQNCYAKPLSVSFDELLEGTVLKTRADITKAKKILGYEPKTPLKEGIQRTIKWIQENNLQTSD